MPISDPTDISGLVTWLAANRQVGLSDGDPVGTADNGGSGADWTASGSQRPTYQTAETPTGEPVFRFIESSEQWLGGQDLSALTGGTIFLLVRRTADPSANDHSSGLWKLSNSSGFDATHYPYTDGNIYDAAGSTTRKTVGNPTPTLADWRIYEVASGSSDWRAYLDGSLLYSDGSSSVGFPAAPKLGRSDSTGGGGPYYLDGDVACLLIYDSVLSSGDAGDVRSWLDATFISGGDGGGTTTSPAPVSATASAVTPAGSLSHALTATSATASCVSPAPALAHAVGAATCTAGVAGVTVTLSNAVSPIAATASPVAVATSLAQALGVATATASAVQPTALPGNTASPAPASATASPASVATALDAAMQPVVATGAAVQPGVQQGTVTSPDPVACTAGVPSFETRLSQLVAAAIATASVRAVSATVDGDEPEPALRLDFALPVQRRKDFTLPVQRRMEF